MNNIKVLLAEDDLNLGTILKEFLEIKGFNVTLSPDGDSALETFKTGKFDLCILDVMMPKIDGFTVAKRIRGFNDQVPIIFLTARHMQQDRIEGLKLGADDYITKPFSTEELLLRIKAIFRRIEGTASSNKELTEFGIGFYRFLPEKRILESKTNLQKLTTKEAELLYLLCENKNKILKRSSALTKIWKEENYFTARSMDVYITKLRNYLKEDKSVEIVNIHGTGYKLIC